MQSIAGDLRIKTLMNEANHFIQFIEGFICTALCEQKTSLA